MLISAGVAVLVALKLMREPATWDMDPTRVIVPLDRPAQYAVAGETNRAILDVDYRFTDTMYRAGKAGLDVSELPHVSDMEERSQFITVINLGTMVYLNCLVRRDLSGAGECRDFKANADPARLGAGLDGLARAYLMEAEGGDPQETARLYIDAGRDIAVAIAGGAGTHTVSERREAAALVIEFTKARAKRILLIAKEDDEDDRLLRAGSVWCGQDDDAPCPGSMSTYGAIKLYLDGHYLEASTTALSAIERRQLWTYRSPYEHPLLWILASSLRHNGEDAAGDFAELIDAALIAWPDDARTALLAYVDPEGLFQAGDDPTVTCTSPGCRYFLAQYHYGSGDSDTGDAMTEVGLELCDSVRSIPCTALRTAQAKIDAGQLP